MERVLRKREHPEQGTQYRLRWVGFNNTYNRWVNQADCHSDELVAEFEARWQVRGELASVGATDAQAEQFYYADRSAYGPGSVFRDGPPAANDGGLQYHSVMNARRLESTSNTGGLGGRTGDLQARGKGMAAGKGGKASRMLEQAEWPRGSG